MQLVGLLLHAGATINARTARGQTSVHLAVQMSNAAVLQQLIDYGSQHGQVQAPQVDVFARDRADMTPLHVAAHVGHPGCCKILLKAGASSSCKDSGGNVLYQ